MSIDELLEKLQENRYGNPDEQLVRVAELLHHAEEDSNLHLKGVALYYKGEAIFSRKDNSAIETLQEALEYLDITKDPELVARCNNMLGIRMGQKENYAEAIHNYLTCLKICEEHNLNYVRGIASCNIAVMFQMLGAYNDAVNYFNLAAVSFQEVSDPESATRMIAALESNLFNCYYHLHDQDQMLLSLDRISEMCDYFEPRYAINLFEALYRRSLNPNANVDSLLATSVEEALQEEEPRDFIDTYQLLCEFLLENHSIDELGQVLDLLEKHFTFDYLPKMQIMFIKYRMEYYRIKQCTDLFEKKAYEYIRMYENITKGYHDSIIDALTLRFYVEELTAKKNRFEKVAYTDSLSKLYNRFGLRTHSKPLLERAKLSQNSIACFIIDIDFFKQYNDFYGHVMGDDCIRAIASVIQSRCNPDCVAARFGGDEFVVIAEDIDEAWAKNFAEILVEDVRTLRIPSERSPITPYVSISIGGYYGPITEDDSLKECIRKADAHLYQAKEGGRDKYILNI